MKVIMMMMTFLLTDAVVSTRLLKSGMEDGVVRPVSAVLEATSRPSCSLILLTDDTNSSFPVSKAMKSERFSPMGITVYEMAVADRDGMVTRFLLHQIISQARQVRMMSWCVSVVVLSNDPVFLTAFAESSLKGRLLVWATRLLVVTRLPLPQLHTLLPSHWTFSMMNTMFLNLEGSPSRLRYRLYTYLPYSPNGAKMVRVGIWSPKQNIVLFTGHPLFPEKFTSFYGAEVNVTIKPWPPYWDEVNVTNADGTTFTKYSGSDYLSLLAIAKALNFSFSFIPVSSFGEAAARVMERKAFILTLNHLALPDRLNRYDITYTYECPRMSFSLAKPGIKPRWQSLYYPLTGQVWAATLLTLLLMPFFFHLISAARHTENARAKVSWGVMVLEVTGILLGQNLPLRLPNIIATRLLLTVWLVFSFIIGTIYRGNLTAALTLPRFPPRPETVEELVNVVDRVSVPPLGGDWKKFMLASESKAYRKLADILLIGPTSKEGLLVATKKNTAQMMDRRNLQFMIARHFTQADGSTRLYVGQEPIFSVPSGMPIPHDAPFTPQLNRCLMAIVESGLLKKWIDDTLREIRRESQRREREKLAKQQDQQVTEEETESSSSVRALTLTHMQGPLMLLFLSLTIAGIFFLGEVLAMRQWKSHTQG